MMLEMTTRAALILATIGYLSGCASLAHAIWGGVRDWVPGAFAAALSFGAALVFLFVGVLT